MKNWLKKLTLDVSPRSRKRWITNRFFPHLKRPKNLRPAGAGWCPARLERLKWKNWGIDLVVFVVGFRRHHAFFGLIQHFGIAQKQRCSTFRRFKNGPKEMVLFRSFFEPLSHFKVAALFGCFFRTLKWVCFIASISCWLAQFRSSHGTIGTWEVHEQLLIWRKRRQAFFKEATTLGGCFTNLRPGVSTSRCQRCLKDTI